MPTCLALPPRWYRTLLATLLFLGTPLGYATETAAAAELKRANSLDMRRAGKVSEDERAVLRIEWRAGMSGVDADRSLAEINDKLRTLESGVTAVRTSLRNLPAKPRVADPVASATAPETEEGPDWRLMLANATALVLVAIWWFSRRKASAEAAAIAAQLGGQTRAEPATMPDSPMERAVTAAPLAEPASASGAGPMFDFEPLPATEAAPVALEAAAPPAQIPAAEPVLPAASTAEPAADHVDPLSLPVLDIDGPASPPAPEKPVATDADPSIDFVLDDNMPAIAAEVAEPTTAVMEIITEPADEPADEPQETSLHMAEIMLSMGLEGDAAKALVDFSDANPKDAIHHMLKLLGIYRKRGLHEEFRVTAEKLRKNFNIQAADWAATDVGESPTLEKFSRVSEHVQALWSRPAECIDYLGHLIEDNREGARAGFPQAVAEEILLLIDILGDSPDAAQEGV